MDDEVFFWYSLHDRRFGIEGLINHINQQLFEDEEGKDYLCLNIDRVLTLIANTSILFEIPQEVEILLHEARRTLTVVGDASIQH